MRGLGKVLILMGVAAFASLARAELPQNYRVNLLTENLPPFNMAAGGKNFAVDTDISGINTDVVREMFKRAGIDYSLSLRFPWARMYQTALDKPDYGLFSTNLSPERKNLFKWVGPLAKTSFVLLSAPNKKISVASLAEAGKFKIGAYANDAVSQELEHSGLNPINALRDQENVKKLMKGEIDLWATTDPVGAYLAKQENVTGLNTVLRFHDGELYLALNLQTPDEVVQRLQKALDAMNKDGTVAKIVKRYIGG